jgi:hypothetical protein
VDLLSCPQCHNKVVDEQKFCPNCGYQLSASTDAILLAKQFGAVKLGKGIHNLAQVRLWEMGRSLGFYSVMEYGIPDLTKEGRRSYIDVVWKSRNGIEFAFEVRRKLHDLNIVTTLKDTNKLQNLVARKKFVVNVSELTGKAYFNEIVGAPIDEVYNALDSSEPNKIEYTKKLTEKHDEVKAKYPRIGLRWTEEEDTALILEFKNNIPIPELAMKHQRKQGGIRARLIHLGLIERL